MVSHTLSLIRVSVVVIMAFVANAAYVQTSLAQQASHTGEAPSLRVKYSDLNLASEEGSRVLYERLVAAAEKVCPPASDTLLAIRINRNAQRCVRDAVDRAVKQIDSPRFAAVAANQRR